MAQQRPDQGNGQQQQPPHSRPPNSFLRLDHASRS
jgi:hypothetical protein